MNFDPGHVSNGRTFAETSRANRVFCLFVTCVSQNPPNQHDFKKASSSPCLKQDGICRYVSKWVWVKYLKNTYWQKETSTQLPVVPIGIFFLTHGQIKKLFGFTGDQLPATDLSAGGATSLVSSS